MIKTSSYKKLISLKRQPLVLLFFSSISFLLILFRLIFLQLLNYESFKKMSDENRIRLIPSQPIRGRILDKKIFFYNYIKYYLEELYKTITLTDLTFVQSKDYNYF